ncbi:MAG: hypothetical protein KBG58_07805 [Giesbergeria sp.]|nr:hypothetical protein [Giesbergeria sp.]
MGGILGQKVSANSKNTDLLLPLYFVVKSFHTMACSARQEKPENPLCRTGLPQRLEI